MKINPLVALLKGIFEWAYKGLLRWWEKFTDNLIGQMAIEFIQSIGTALRFVFLHPYTLIVILLLQKLWLVLVVLFMAYAPLGAMDQAFDVFYALVNEQNGWDVWAHITAFLFAITVWFSCRLLFIFFDLGKVLERIDPATSQRKRIQWLLQRVREIESSNKVLRKSFLIPTPLKEDTEESESKVATEEEVQGLLDKIQAAIEGQGEANDTFLTDLKKVPDILRTWDTERLQFKSQLKAVKSSGKIPTFTIPKDNLRNMANELQQLADQTSETEDFLRSLVRWTPPILGLLPFFLLLRGVGGHLWHLVALTFEIVFYFVFYYTRGFFITT